MTVVPFKRPENRDGDKTQSRTTARHQVAQKSLAQFAVAMVMTGLVCFLMPTLWQNVPTQLLAVINLLIAVVYFQQGPRIAAAIWIALSLAVLVMTGSPSPVAYALTQGAAAINGVMR